MSDADDKDENAKNQDDKKESPGLSTNEMLWILLAIAAVLIISRFVGNLL